VKNNIREGKMDYYFKRFKEIDTFQKKIGITAFFFMRRGLRLYYETKNTKYNTQWEESKSTKVKFNQNI